MDASFLKNYLLALLLFLPVSLPAQAALPLQGPPPGQVQAAEPSPAPVGNPAANPTAGQPVGAQAVGQQVGQEAGQASGPAAPSQNGAERNRENSLKTAIVVVSEGSTHLADRQPLLEFEKNLQAAYPNLPVLRAFTSAPARDAVRGTAEDTPSLPGALSILADTGYSSVVILPTRVLPDAGYDELLATAESLAPCRKA